MPEYCVPFSADQCDAGAVELVGGKNASLGELIDAGSRVPPGFAVTTEFYERFLEESDLGAYISDQLTEDSSLGPEEAAEVGQRIRETIRNEPFPDELDRAVSSAWEELQQRCDGEDVQVAIRSSATAEDLPDASFAGQQDTYLNIGTLSAVKGRVRDCIASLFTDRAISYREERGFDHDEVLISVGVQKMVDARASGVMFTLNPSNGDRSKVRIEANWGLGEAVVSGEVTPDSYLVDKAVKQVVDESVSTKNVMTVNTSSGTELADVPEEKRDEPCLSTDEIRELTTRAKHIENHYGEPQDIEWAIEDTGDESILYVLQSRPETTWQDQTDDESENESTGSASEGVSAVDQMLNTLNGDS